MDTIMDKMMHKIIAMVYVADTGAAVALHVQ
jgi:hypothetical protein